MRSCLLWLQLQMILASSFNVCMNAIRSVIQQRRGSLDYLRDTDLSDKNAYTKMKSCYHIATPKLCSHGIIFYSYLIMWKVRSNKCNLYSPECFRSYLFSFLLANLFPLCSACKISSKFCQVSISCYYWYRFKNGQFFPKTKN